MHVAKWGSRRRTMEGYEVLRDEAVWSGLPRAHRTAIIYPHPSNPISRKRIEKKCGNGQNISVGV